MSSGIVELVIIKLRANGKVKVIMEVKLNLFETLPEVVMDTSSSTLS